MTPSTIIILQMRALIAVLLFAFALSLNEAAPGKRTLVILESDTLKTTHSLFFSNLESRMVFDGNEPQKRDAS